MPTTSPPDGSEVFTGETLEEAMSAAVAARGPDLVVEHARRVRSGVRGLLGKERYEVVVAAPSASSPGGGDPVEAALAALLDDADAQEAVPARAPESRARAAAPAPRRELAPQVRPVRPATSEPEVVAEPPAVAEDPPATGTAPRVVLEGVALPPAALDGPTSPPARSTGTWQPMRRPKRPPVPHPDPSVAEHADAAGPSWSRARLERLGVPARVLSALPSADPADDLAWVVALTHAIASCVPSPGSASAATPVVVDGHELAGAVAILEMCSHELFPAR